MNITFYGQVCFLFQTDETKMGTHLKSEVIFSEGELTPSRSTVEVEAEMFGKQTTALRVRLQASMQSIYLF